MESYTEQWYNDMGIDDIFFNEWEMNEFTSQDNELDQTLVSTEAPTKSQKITSWSSSKRDPNSTSSPNIISFGRAFSQKETLDLCNNYVNVTDIKPKIHGPKRKYEDMSVEINTVPSNKDHVLAERRRREKLSERFVALSAIVPGLKKLDKASVLGGAIKYLKQLEEKAKKLEEQESKRKFESSVTFRNSQLSAVDSDSSSDVDFDDQQCDGHQVPEIEAKMSHKTILLKIHCENRKGLLVKVLADIEKSHLRIVNTNVLQFAPSSLDITIMTQIEEEFSMTVKDIVKKLSCSLKA